MNFNFGYLINKLIKKMYRPALKNCQIDLKSKVGSGSNLINVKMGKYSYCGNYTTIVNTDIGSYCSIASYCAVGGGTHPIEYVSTSPVFYAGRNIFRHHISNLDYSNDVKVIIGNDVWIGEAVFISPGVKIGDGAIVGAHSVVTKDVEPYSIVAGVPAKHLRYRFTENVKDMLLKTRWWEKNENQLSEMDFSNPTIFIKEFEQKTSR